MTLKRFKTREGEPMRTNQYFGWKKVGAFVLVGTLTIGTAGCGKVAEEIAETAIESNMPDGSNVEINHDGGNINIQGSTGDGGSVNVQAGESVALPGDFPEDIPTPAGITWNLVQSGQVDGKASVTAQGAVKSPMADVSTFLKKEAEGKGWTSDQTFQQAGQMEMLTYKKDERMLHFTITNTGDETTVLISSQ